jgi:hypothetical protein
VAGQSDKKKNSEMAARMKLLGIRRTTGQCPMGCGASIPNGGNALLAHMGRCKGKRR